MQIEDQEQEILLEPEVLSSVISVNGKTGNVVLTTSDLENDSDYQTGEDVQNALEGAIGTGTLTVQKNSTTVGTFNANANSDTTIDLSVPTTTSELTNDANYQTGNEVANSISTHNQSSSAHQDIRQAITNEQNARINADNGLQGQIDAITSASDVVDIVGTYAALEAYDTQHLKDNDVIKVLQDETHNEAMSYYRWSTTTHTWTYIGSEGPYYTKSETNTLLDEKLDADEVPDGFFDGPATISPTPATSVEIQDSIKLATVQLDGDTFQQTYSGKNLWSFNTGTFTNNSGSSQTQTHTDTTLTLTAVGTTGAQFITWITPELDSTKTYTISGKAKKIVKGTDGQPYIRVAYSYSDDGSTWSSNSNAYNNTSVTQGEEYSFSYTLPSGHKYYRLRCYNNTGMPVTIGENTTYYDLQLEANTIATAFEPYVGGIAAPNPDYPQNINVVTGTQTITATDGDSQSQTYTIDLGSIELYKIGNYQDYIYKSGNDWFVHKEIGKVVFNGTETWGQVNSYAYFSTQISTDIIRPSDIYAKPLILSDYYSPTSRSNLYDSVVGYGIGVHENTPSRILIRNKDYASIPAFTTWLSNHNTTVYYVLATPTDTQITNAALIGQLTALLNATIYSPTTTMTSSGSLPVILDVTAFTDNLNSILEILKTSLYPRQ